MLTFLNKIYFLNIYVIKIFPISIYIGNKFSLINLIKSNYYEEPLRFHNTVYSIYFKNEKSSWSFKNLEMRILIKKFRTIRIVITTIPLKFKSSAY